MRYLWLICILVLGGATFAADSLTSAERVAVAQAAAQREQACLSAFSDKISSPEDPMGITRGFVNGVCGCIRADFTAKIDAKMLREGTVADGQKFMIMVERNCVMEEFKKNFPNQCQVMMDGLMRGSTANVSRENIKIACECVQEAVVKAAESTQFDAIVQQTIREYKAYVNDHGYEPTLPLSLFATMKSCALRVQNGN